MEHLDDLGRRQQHRPTPAGTLGERGQHLHPVARPEALGHASRAGLDRQLHQIGISAGGEHQLCRNELLATDRGDEHAARHGSVWARPQVVAQGRVGKADPEDHEIAVSQLGAGRQVTGGCVHRHQPLGAVQEQRTGQDREHMKPAPSAVRPLIQVASAGGGLGPPVEAAGEEESKLRGGWSSVARRCLIRAYPIKGVI
jgi:hypothetical protein